MSILIESLTALSESTHMHTKVLSNQWAVVGQPCVGSDRVGFPHALRVSNGRGGHQSALCCAAWSFDCGIY
jgi:hypothetical protein